MNFELPKRELRRRQDKGKIAGVCAGLADYFNIETWLVRVVFFTGLIFSSGFFAVLYFALWFILDKGPSVFDNKTEGHGPIRVKDKIWAAGEPPKQAFQEIYQDFQEMEQSLQKMERYVTSSEFTLNREFKQL